MQPKSRILTAFVLMTLALSLYLGCGGDNKNPAAPQAPTPPSFTISSVNVDLADGSAGIQFFGKSSKDVSLIKVNIANPIGGEITFNAGGDVFLKDEVIALQDANTGYFRVSGSWTFKFIGNLEPSKDSFEVTQSLNVSASSQL
ncbi:MAG: hypothetical protein ACE5HI_11525 [bacterium]